MPKSRNVDQGTSLGHAKSSINDDKSAEACLINAVKSTPALNQAFKKALRTQNRNVTTQQELPTGVTSAMTS